MGTHGPGMSKDMFAVQRGLLEDWYTRLPISRYAARRLAEQNLEHGLDEIRRKIGREPDARTVFAFRRVFSPARFLASLLHGGQPYLTVGWLLMRRLEEDPHADPDKVWDELAERSSQPVVFSDGTHPVSGRRRAPAGRLRFMELCARVNVAYPIPSGLAGYDSPMPSRPHPNGPDYRPAYLWAVRWLRALHAPENTLHRLALDVLDRMRGRAGSADPLAPLSRALGGVDAIARVALTAARLALNDGMTRIRPEHWRAAARTIGVPYGVPDGIQGLLLWVDRIRYASRGWESDRPPYGRYDLYDGDDYDDILALADLDRELERLDASLAAQYHHA